MMATMLLGRSDNETYLPSFGLGVALWGITYGAIFLSMLTCLETLVSQAYGAKDLHMCGVYLNRQILINFFYFAILSVPQFFAYSIFNDAFG